MMEINELAAKQIYELKPLEMVSAKDLGIGQGYSILRVPGGWIFIYLDSSCFVPWIDQVDFDNQLKSKVPDIPKVSPIPKKKNFRKKTTKSKNDKINS